MKLTRPDKTDVDNLTATRALEVLGFTVDRLMYEVLIDQKYIPLKRIFKIIVFCFVVTVDATL